MRSNRATWSGARALARLALPALPALLAALANPARTAWAQPEQAIEQARSDVAESQRTRAQPAAPPAAAEPRPAQALPAPPLLPPPRDRRDAISDARYMIAHRLLAHGDAWLRAGQPGRALPHYQRAERVLALDDDPGRTDVVLRIGLARARLGQCAAAQRAVEVVRPALHSQPERAPQRVAAYRVARTCAPRG